MLNIKARCGTQSQNHHVDGGLSLEALKDMMMRAFCLSSHHFDILSGFPPTVIKLAADEPISHLIKNNEVIQIRMHSSGESSMASTTNATTSKTKKSQDKATTSRSSTTSTTKKSSASVSRGFGAQIHTLHGSTSKKSASSSRATSTPTKKRRITPLTASSEEDISVHLLAAVSGGAGKLNRGLRSVFRRAVELEYDNTKALARVAAAQSGKFTIRESTSNRVLGSGAAATMTVQFHKGAGARSYYFETVDMLNAQTLTAVIKLILASGADEDVVAGDEKEFFRPLRLATQSPRIFWSIVRLYGGDIVSGLQLLVPEQDWGYISERKRELSAKAKANLEQQNNTRRLQSKRRKTEDKPSVVEEDEDPNPHTNDDATTNNPIDLLVELLEKQISQANAFLEANLRMSNDLFAVTRSVLCSHLSGDVAKSEVLLALSNCDDTLELARTLNNTTENYDKSTFARNWVTTAHLRFWRDRSRQMIADILWNNIICCGQEMCKSALSSAGVKNIKELDIWHHSPHDFYKHLTSQTSSVAELMTCEHITAMCTIVHAAKDIDDYSWLGDWAGADEGTVHPLDEVKVDCAAEGDDDWLLWNPEDVTSQNIEARLGEFVFIEDGESAELGQIVGYLAAVDEDTISVWKVLVETGDVLEVEGEDEMIAARAAYDATRT